MPVERASSVNTPSFRWSSWTAAVAVSMASFAAVALAGESSTASVPPDDAGLESVDPADHPVGIVLVGEYLPLLSPADEQAMLTISSTSTADCMARRGFTWTAPPPYGSEAFWTFHPLDRESGRRWGYHRNPASIPAGDDQVTDPEMIDALHGTETTQGCAALARAQTIGTLDWFVESVQLAINDTRWISGDFETTTDGAETLDAWSDCMAELGYDYDDRDAPAIEFTDDGREVSEKEIQVRMADIDCDIRSGYTAADSAHQRALLERWIDDNAGRVAQLRADYERFQDQLGVLLDDVES